MAQGAPPRQTDLKRLAVYLYPDDIARLQMMAAMKGLRNAAQMARQIIRERIESERV